MPYCSKSECLDDLQALWDPVEDPHHENLSKSSRPADLVIGKQFVQGLTGCISYKFSWVPLVDLVQHLFVRKTVFCICLEYSHRCPFPPERWVDSDSVVWDVRDTRWCRRLRSHLVSWMSRYIYVNWMRTMRGLRSAYETTRNIRHCWFVPAPSQSLGAKKLTLSGSKVLRSYFLMWWHRNKQI